MRNVAYMHEVRAIGDRWVDSPFLRVSAPPLHDVPQDLRAFPVEEIGQGLQFGMRFRIEAHLLPHAIAALARLWLWCWVHGGPLPWKPHIRSGGL